MIKPESLSISGEGENEELLKRFVLVSGAMWNQLLSAFGGLPIPNRVLKRISADDTLGLDSRGQ